MRIAIRTDASTSIGTGHIMRCLTLAHLLCRQGCDVFFLTAGLEGHLHELIKERGFESVLLDIPEGSEWQTDAAATCRAIAQSGAAVDWLIVDHYALDVKWEDQVRNSGSVGSIMVIDDLANREHRCELLLDQNYATEMEARYDFLVPPNCVRLLGPRYLLLRDELVQSKPASMTNRRQALRRMVLFFGGSDPTNETAKALAAVEHFLDIPLQVDVIVGRTNPNGQAIEDRCARHVNLHFHRQVNHLGQLMSRADMSIGAGGVTMWERCYLGVPSAVVIVADNQKRSVEAAAAQGAVLNLGWHASVTVSDMIDVIQKALTGQFVMADMSRAGRALFGKESTSRPGNEIVEAMAALRRSKDQSI